MPRGHMSRSNHLSQLSQLMVNKSQYETFVCWHTNTGRQPSYRDNWNWTALKSVPTPFRSILTHYFLYKYIMRSHIFISLLSSMFSSTLLIFLCNFSCPCTMVVVECKCKGMCQISLDVLPIPFHVFSALNEKKELDMIRFGHVCDGEPYHGDGGTGWKW